MWGAGFSNWFTLPNWFFGVANVAVPCAMSAWWVKVVEIHRNISQSCKRRRTSRRSKTYIETQRIRVYDTGVKNILQTKPIGGNTRHGNKTPRRNQERSEPIQVTTNHVPRRGMVRIENALHAPVSTNRRSNWFFGVVHVAVLIILIYLLVFRTTTDLII